jgi:hypothetical protein
VSEQTYAVEFTHAAKVEAEKWPGGLVALEAQVRQEIAELLEEGLGSVGDLFFHTIIDEDGPRFICKLESDDKLIVDACEQQDAQELDSGPLDWRRVIIPKGVTS